ncbi:unnamed protein product, partial [Rotaria sp. Silwood1]
QDEFYSWYRGALPPCEACGSIQLSTMITSSKSSCICSKNSPYVNPADKWLLQNAVFYTVNRFLDKSSTNKNWSVMLDPNYSSLSSYEQHKRINYAIYDCFVVTLLHQAIYDKWSLIKLREAQLISLFTSNAPPHSSSLATSTFLENISDNEHEVTSTSLLILNAPRHPSSLPLSTLLEDISEDESDDEIFMSSISRHHAHDDDVIEPIVSDQELSSNEPPKLRRKCRSVSARTRRNRKRNMIKNILRARNVRYAHLTLHKSSQVLSIGMKKPSLVDLHFDRLPGDLFDKEHYQHYRQNEH